MNRPAPAAGGHLEPVAIGRGDEEKRRLPSHKTSRRVARLALATVLLAGLALAALSIGACVAAPDLGIVNGRLRPCPGTPNCVGSEDSPAVAATHAVRPFVLRGDPDASFAELVLLVGSQPRTEILAREDGYARFAVRTPLWRFTDDLELRLDRVARVAHVRSASRVGRSDFGANRERVEALRALWDGSAR